MREHRGLSVLRPNGSPPRRHPSHSRHLGNPIRWWCPADLSCPRLSGDWPLRRPSAKAPPPAAAILEERIRVGGGGLGLGASTALAFAWAGRALDFELNERSALVLERDRPIGRARAVAHRRSSSKRSSSRPCESCRQTRSGTAWRGESASACARRPARDGAGRCSPPESLASRRVPYAMRIRRWNGCAALFRKPEVNCVCRDWIRRCSGRLRDGRRCTPPARCCARSSSLAAISSSGRGSCAGRRLVRSSSNPPPASRPIPITNSC